MIHVTKPPASPAGTGFHPHRTAYAEVLRRPSPLDVPAQSWAVVGLGDRGLRALTVLEAAGLPVLGYDAASTISATGPARTWLGHRVIALAEIDDIDAIAVTSRAEQTGEINTDYFLGVVVATGATVVAGGDAADLLPDPGAATVFSPYHPAVIDLTRTSADMANEAVELVLAPYARRLAEAPRAGLAMHRELVRRESGEGLTAALAATVAKSERTPG